MLNEIKQTKDKISAFEYNFDPLTKLKISDELKNNPHFIGFGVDKKPIIADISAVKVFVDENSYGYEIPIYNEYAWVGMDDFEQPIYQDTDEYLIEIRDAWCELYKFKFKNNKALALEEYEQLYHQELALIGEGEGKAFEKCDTPIIIGYTPDQCFIGEPINSGYYIYDYNAKGYPLWNGLTIINSAAMPYAYYNYMLTTYINSSINSGKSVFTSYPKFDRIFQQSKLENERKHNSAMKDLENRFSNSNSVQNNKLPKNVLLSDASYCETDVETEFVDIDTCSTKWKSFAQSITGVQHLKNNIPCQDASVVFDDKNFNVLVVSDGCGSSKFSQFTSKELTLGMKRFVVSTYNMLFSSLLNNKNLTDDVIESNLHELKQSLTKHAIGLVKDMIENEHERTMNDFADFYATLLMAVVGKEKTFWFKVGDGGIVVQRAYKDENNKVVRHNVSLDDKTKSKGNMANETHYICPTLAQEHIQFGLIDNDNLSGIVLMTDGVSERLISQNNTYVSNRLNNFTNDLNDDKFDFYNFLQEKDFLKNYVINENDIIEKEIHSHNGDDCSIAMLSRLTDSEQFVIDEEKRLKEAKRKEEEARKRQVWYTGSKIYTTNGKSSVASTTSSSSIYSAYSDRSLTKNSDDNDDFNDYINFKQ